MKRRDAQSNLRGWLALTKGHRFDYNAQRLELAWALRTVRNYRAQKGATPGVLPANLESQVRAALERIATATGHPTRAYQVHAAAPHNVGEDGHLLNIPDWWDCC